MPAKPSGADGGKAGCESDLRQAGDRNFVKLFRGVPARRNHFPDLAKAS
jgi:hypothetical protein